MPEIERSVHGVPSPRAGDRKTSLTPLRPDPLFPLKSKQDSAGGTRGAIPGHSKRPSRLQRRPETIHTWGSLSQRFSLLLYASIALTNPLSTTPPLAALLRRYSGATQAVTRKAIKTGLDKWAVLCDALEF